MIFLKSQNPGEQILEAHPKMCSISDDIRESQTDAFKEQLIPAHHSSHPMHFSPCKSWAHPSFPPQTHIKVLSLLLLRRMESVSVTVLLQYISKYKLNQKLKLVMIIQSLSQLFLKASSSMQHQTCKLLVYPHWGLLYFNCEQSARYSYLMLCDVLNVQRSGCRTL